MPWKKVVVTVEGYSYKRALGYFYRKIKGRRKRFTRWQHVEVPGYSYTRKVFVKAAPKPKKPKAPAAKWYNAAEYQQALVDQKAIDGYEQVEIDGDIYLSSPATDVIQLPLLFVWSKPQLPTRQTRKYRKLDGGIGETAKIFRMVRIWFWVWHSEKDEYRLWCRTVSLPEADFKEAHDFAKALYDEVSKDLSETYTYIEVHGLVAWTAYQFGQLSQRIDKRTRKAGGTE